MIEPDDILEKLPKRTPVWAVGAVTIIISLVVSISAVYVLAKGEFQQYLTAHFTEKQKILELHTKEFEQESLTSRKAFDTVLGLIQVNSEQITGLSVSNAKLSDRITALEKELASKVVDLKACEESLRVCKR